MVIGIALLLTGVGFLVLTVGACTRLCRNDNRCRLAGASVPVA
jgi:hypothetical protein